MERTHRGLRGALPAPFVRLQSQEWHVGSAPSTIGTPNAWYVSAFTAGNDLAANLQTLLTCQCAVEPALGLMPYGLTTPLRTVVVYYLAIRLSSEYTASMNKPTTVRLAPQD